MKKITILTPDNLFGSAALNTREVNNFATIFDIRQLDSLNQDLPIIFDIRQLDSLNQDLPIIFDIRQLGSLSQDSPIHSKFTTEFTNKAVSIKSMPAAGNFLGLSASATGTRGVFNATFTTAIAGETLSVNGVTFTALANGTARTAGSLTFQAGNGAGGANDAFAVADFVAAVNDIKVNGTAAQKIALANYNVTGLANVVTVTQVTNHDEVLAQALYSSNGVTMALLETAVGVTASGPNVQSQLTIGELANVVAGDSVVIEGVTFKAVAGEPTKDNEFKVGVSKEDSAGNLAAAIQGSKSETLQAFTTSIAGNVITLTRVSQGANGIIIINKSANIVGIEKTKGVGSGIDLSGIKSLDGFISASSKPIFALERQETGLGAKALAKAAGNDLAGGAAAAAAGDSVAIYSTMIGGRKFTGAFYEVAANDADPVAIYNAMISCRIFFYGASAAADDADPVAIYKAMISCRNFFYEAAAAEADSVAIYKAMIGGKKFTGALYEADAAPNLNNAQLRMVEEDTGEFFTITAAAGYAGRVNTAAAVRNTVADLNILFANTTFSETKTLKVNTDKGDILVNNVPIASTKGTVVKLTATDFTNLRFKDIKIGPGYTLGDAKFTAVITDKDGNDQEYTNNVAAADISLMIKGYKLDLTDSTGGTGNVLSINIGDRGLTNLNLEDNYAPVAEAYKEMLLSIDEDLGVMGDLDFVF